MEEGGLQADKATVRTYDWCACVFVWVWKRGSYDTYEEPRRPRAYVPARTVTSPLSGQVKGAQPRSDPVPASSDRGKGLRIDDHGLALHDDRVGLFYDAGKDGRHPQCEEVGLLDKKRKKLNKMLE